MFLDLINLYQKSFNSRKTPLEDFNTECFANILKLFKDVKNDYLSNFLNLPADNYEIKTQYKKQLPNSEYCIIDLVFIGKNNICFVENKIESFEGFEQLKRYGALLDHHFLNYNKNLHYCTKYSDPKNKSLELIPFKFKQYKWFEIAKFLKKYSTSNPLINEYLVFLNKYKMAQDNTFKIENLLTLENMLKTVEIAEFHINNSKGNFNELFDCERYNYNFNWSQFREHNRFCHYRSGIISSASNKYSEVLYSIEFSRLKLNCQIYIVLEHEEHDSFMSIDISGGSYLIETSHHGTTIFLEEDLGKFLNNEDSDFLIKSWFSESFAKFIDLINNNPQISWKK